jgi:hypothetical protein
MKNVHEVLRQKEADRERIMAEIDALRLAIPLLEDEQNTSKVGPDHPSFQNSHENAEPSAQSASGGGWLDRWKTASR